MDGLCSNLSVLSVSATALNPLEGGDDQETTLSYRNALKAYTVLLHLILSQVDHILFLQVFGRAHAPDIADAPPVHLMRKEVQPLLMMGFCDVYLKEKAL